MDGMYTESGHREWTGPRFDLLLRSADCTDTMFSLWLEQPDDPHPQMNQSQQRLYIYQDHLEAVVLKCNAVDKVVVLDVTVNAQEQVLSTRRNRSLTDGEMAELYPRTRNTSLASSFFDRSSLVGGTISLRIRRTPSG